jgi:hypothetical protein
MMKRISVILFSFLPLLSSLSIAEDKGHGVDVRQTSAELLETEPGKIVTASFLVSNRTEAEEEFLEELSLPPTWQKVVSDEPSFTLKAGEFQVRIMAFLVPLSASAGRHRIRYSATSQRDYTIVDSDSLSVVVLPVVKLEVLVENKPEVVIAGDAYRVALRLLNLSNSRVDAELKIRSSPDYPVKLEPSEMALDVGESQIIRVEVNTDEKLKREVTQILEIHAEAKESRNGMVSVRQTVSVEIIPKVTGEFDPYHRLPIQLGMVVAGRDERAGVQAEISGAGSLDEEGKRMVDFLFRSPDIQGQSSFGKRDEFRIGYRYENLSLHAGDRSYSLSPLTERFVYGRGVEARTSRGNFGFGGFFVQKRWQKPRERELGTYLAYRFNDALSIKANFLGKSKLSTVSLGGYDDEILSIEAELQPNETAKLDLEFGLSDCDRNDRTRDAAFRIDLDGHADDIWYSFEKTYAGPDYFGYYKNISYTNGAVTFPIHDKLRGNLSYRSYKTNLDLDSARGTANREKSYRGGIRYSFPFGTSVSLELEDLIREDYVLPADYNYEEWVWKLGVAHSFGKLSLHSYAERGKFEDRLLGRTNDKLERYSLYVHFRPDRRQSYSLYANTGHSSFTASPERITNWGGSAAWQIKNNVSFDLNYRQDESPSRRSQSRRDAFSTLSYALPNKHALVLKSQWSEYQQKREEDFSFFVMYTVPLRLPVSKKKSVGVLRGKVYDEERPTRPPIPTVILTTQGATAITDKKGEFIFPSLQPGIYFLRVDKSSIGLNRVTSEKLPITVEVKGGETAEIEIGVVTSCRIAGRVAIFPQGADIKLGDEDTTSTEGLFVVGSGEDEDFEEENLKKGVGLGNTLVEVADGKEILRQLTDAKGGFSFDDLRPGEWRVKVYDYDLPPYHYLEEEEFQIQLKPGESKEVTVRILPRLRPIQIIEEGKIE